MDDRSQPPSDAFEREWTREFHGILYQISIAVSTSNSQPNVPSVGNTSMLRIEVEQVDNEDNDRWNGEFTSQYVEEITHKAGNFKKFSVFTKMLSAAFTEEKDSVLYVDLLTYSDLELLKARKNGGVNNLSNNTQAVQSNKRYVILTYSGEFDRVHYPLPLIFENPQAPNLASWKRTINRLRTKIKNRPEIAPGATSDLDPSISLGEKEREREGVRQMLTQLRQENTELRHRLRQIESRANNANNSNTSIVARGVGGNVIANSNLLNNDLLVDNTKLRKQLIIIKKELNDINISFDKYRTESAKEIGKWKTKTMRIPSVSTDLNVSNSLDIYLPQSQENNLDIDKKDESKDREMQLKRRILALERDLSIAKSEGRKGFQAGVRNASRMSRSNTPPTQNGRDKRRDGGSGGSGNENDKQRGREKDKEKERESLRERERKRERSRGRSGGYISGRSLSSGGHRRMDSLLHSPISTSTYAAALHLRERERERGVSGYGSNNSRDSRTQHHLIRPPLGYTPSSSSNRPGGSASPNRGRFDPTAYQQRKDEITREKYNRSTNNRSNSRSNSNSRGREGYHDGDAIGQRTSTSTGYGSDNSKGNGKGRDIQNGRNMGGKQKSTHTSDNRSKYRNDRSRYGTYAESGYSSTGSQSSTGSKLSDRSNNTNNTNTSNNGNKNRNRNRNQIKSNPEISKGSKNAGRNQNQDSQRSQNDDIYRTDLGSDSDKRKKKNKKKSRDDSPIFSRTELEERSSREYAMLMRKGGGGRNKDGHNDDDFFSTYNSDGRNISKSGDVSTDIATHNSYVSTMPRSLSVFGSDKSNSNSNNKNDNDNDKNHNNYGDNDNTKSKTSANTNTKININTNAKTEKMYDSNRTSIDSTDNKSTQQKILHHVHSQLQLQLPLPPPLSSGPQNKFQVFLPARISEDSQNNENSLPRKSKERKNDMSQNKYDENSINFSSRSNRDIDKNDVNDKNNYYYSTNSSYNMDHNDHNDTNNNNDQRSTRQSIETLQKSSFSTSRNTVFKDPNSTSTFKDSTSTSTSTSKDSVLKTSNTGAKVKTGFLDPVPSTETVKITTTETETDISEIDRRILALQDYLENARVGILRESIGGSASNSPLPGR